MLIKSWSKLLKTPFSNSFFIIIFLLSEKKTNKDKLFHCNESFKILMDELNIVIFDRWYNNKK